MTMTTTEAKQKRDVFPTHFERFEKNGGPAWLTPIRKAAIARFTELGFPTTKHEEWRFTNVSPIARTAFDLAPDGDLDDAARLIAPNSFGDNACRLVFVNGRYSPELSLTVKLPAGVRASALSEAFARDGRIVQAHLTRHAPFDSDTFTALNTALLTDGPFVYIPRGVALETPIEVLYLAVGGDSAWSVHPRGLIIVEENAQVRVTETYAGSAESPYLANPVTELVVGENAVVDHYRINREPAGAYHLGAMFLHQLRGATTRSANIIFGGGLVRNDVNAVLDGEGGTCVLNGLTMIRGRQHADNHLVVNHAMPRCDSKEYYKGIYDEQSAGVFSGRINVFKDAQKTDAKQTNKSLLLSREAHVDSKPQLEIFADDVKCTHGATIGQLDDTAIFYLQSRGIPEREARNMLVHAFASEVVGRVRYAPLKEKLDLWVADWLRRGANEPEAN
jgi:Fe-S cluster assembly protein SufD